MKEEKKSSTKSEVQVGTDGSKHWVLNGKFHREDGPAIDRADGTKEWRINGKLHRIDGPAYDNPNGRREWWLNGKEHRLDGPAVEDPEGFNEFWINGTQYSHQAFTEKIQAIQSIKKSSTDPVKKIEKELEEFTDHQLEKLAKVVNRIKTQRKLIVSLNSTSKKPKI